MPIKIFKGQENAEAKDDTGILRDEINKIDYPGQPKNGDITQIKAFGLNRDENDHDWFSYYIGLDYLDDANHVPLYVAPKIDNLDYYTMMKTCLKSPKTAHYMPQVYDIRVKKPFIQPPTEMESNRFILLIMHHYLVLLKELVKKPLAKSYIYKTENLKSKIKGKILLSEHIKKNISNKRYDKIMCGFDEYSTDCPANRLLHSAYIICRDYIKKYNFKKSDCFKEYDYIKSYFQGIGRITNSVELNAIKTNPLFLEYKDAIRVAKIIYRSKNQRENMQAKESFIKIPPYIIDMSKLFELYVFAKLEEAGLPIGYHERGNYGETDFLDYDAKIVIDTKYKKIYDSDKQGYKIEDIRQVSGYARDIGVLKKLYGDDKTNWENVVPNCLIIYPDQKNGYENMPKSSSDFIKDDEKHQISQFNKFYKYGHCCPV